MSVQAIIPTWIVLFGTIVAIAIFVRLASATRVWPLLLVFTAVGISLYGWALARSRPPQIVIASPEGWTMGEIEEPLPPPTKPMRAKRAPKPKPVTRAAPPAVPATGDSDSPPPPPVAGVTEVPAVAESIEPAVEEAPLMVYKGTSKKGLPVESLPGWVTELADARVGLNSVAFSSDRFASIEEAEKQLWLKARDFVARDLRQRIPDAIHWSPSAELLKARGLIVERCVERTAIEVGQFVEPMYRVHWKASLSRDLRDAVADSWRPEVQRERLAVVGAGFLGMTGFFAALNIVLRSIAARVAAKKTPAAA